MLKHRPGPSTMLQQRENTRDIPALFKRTVTQMSAGLCNV